MVLGRWQQRIHNKEALSFSPLPLHSLEQKDTCITCFPFQTRTNALHKYTHSQSQQLWIPSMHSASWAVPATDKWAVECRDGPCDRTWHSDTFTSLDSQGWSDTVALTHATATADQSVTLLENSRAGRKRAASSMRGRKREFLWGCVRSCVSVMQVWTCMFLGFFCDVRGCDMSQQIQALILQSKVTYTWAGSLIGTSQEKMTTLKKLNHNNKDSFTGKLLRLCSWMLFGSLGLFYVSFQSCIEQLKSFQRNKWLNDRCLAEPKSKAKCKLEIITKHSWMYKVLNFRWTLKRTVSQRCKLIELVFNLCCINKCMLKPCWQPTASTRFLHTVCSPANIS